MFPLPKNEKVVTKKVVTNLQIVTFVKFNKKIFSFSLVLCKKVYLCNII